MKYFIFTTLSLIVMANIAGGIASSMKSDVEELSNNRIERMEDMLGE